MSKFSKSNNSSTSNQNQNVQSNYSLHNKENYKPKLETTINEIMDKYSKLVIEYLFFIIENLNNKNVNYSKFIIIRGLKTISHVFSKLLFYSNNLDMTYFHSQKSFYFYVEFIGQISEDQHSFLHLSSKDASIFVYKKTIFEINDEIIKNSSQNSHHQLFDLFDYYSFIIITFFIKIINFLDFNQNIEMKKKYFEENIVICQKITNKILKEKVNSTYFHNIINLINKLDNCKNIQNYQYFSILENYIKKHNLYHPNNLDNIIIDVDLFEVLNQNLYNPDKFIKLLLAQH